MLGVHDSCFEPLGFLETNCTIDLQVWREITFNLQVRTRVPTRGSDVRTLDAAVCAADRWHTHHPRGTVQPQKISA
jgi:hypothetical protein